MLTTRQHTSLIKLSAKVNALPSGEMVRLTQAQTRALRAAYHAAQSTGNIPADIQQLAKTLGL